MSIITVCNFSPFYSVSFIHLNGITVNKNVAKKEHPEALRPFVPEISEFIKYNHFNILFPLLRYVFPGNRKTGSSLGSFDRLLAVGLELPEDTFVKQHGFDAEGETWGVHHSAFPCQFDSDFSVSPIHEIVSNDLYVTILFQC